MNHFYFIPTEAVYPDGTPFYLPVRKGLYDDFILSITHLGYSYVENIQPFSSASVYHYVELKGIDHEVEQ